MSGARKLTREELDALQAEIRSASGDGWTAELTEIDGVPAEQYVPADEAGSQEARMAEIAEAFDELRKLEDRRDIIRKIGDTL